MLLKVLGGIRALPVGGDVKAATELLTTVKVRPLNPTAGWTEPTWLDLTPEPQDTTPGRWEDNLGFWEALHEVIDTEPPLDGYRPPTASWPRWASPKGSRSRPMPG
jgi:hypothetical protein